MREDGTMWRQLLEHTDQLGRTMVAIAGTLLAIAVVSFVYGVIRASTGFASTTLPFWITTMVCAVAAGALVYGASRRADQRHR